MYIAIDTEHTGFHPQSCLLTAAFIVFDKTGMVIDFLELDLKHDIYSVDPKAMEVNKIDILEHDKVAEPLNVCNHKLKKFLSKYSRPHVGEFLTPVGSGVKADINLLKSSGLYTTGLSHKVMDLTVIASFLKEADLLEVDSVSLENLAEFFYVEHKSPHQATSDAIASKDVFMGLLDCIDDLRW